MFVVRYIGMPEEMSGEKWQEDQISHILHVFIVSDTGDTEVILWNHCNTFISDTCETKIIMWYHCNIFNFHIKLKSCETSAEQKK